MACGTAHTQSYQHGHDTAITVHSRVPNDNETHNRQTQSGETRDGLGLETSEPNRTEITFSDGNGDAQL